MNKNTQHTLSPWTYSPHYKANAEGHLFLGKEGACTITLTGAASMPQEELNEFGKLIAAAPNLLAELKGLLEVFTAYIETEDVANGDIVEAVRDARAAIAEAQGGAE